MLTYMWIPSIYAERKCSILCALTLELSSKKKHKNPLPPNLISVWQPHMWFYLI